MKRNEEGFTQTHTGQLKAIELPAISFLFKCHILGKTCIRIAPPHYPNTLLSLSYSHWRKGQVVPVSFPFWSPLQILSIFICMRVSAGKGRRDRERRRAMLGQLLLRNLLWNALTTSSVVLNSLNARPLRTGETQLKLVKTRVWRMARRRTDEGPSLIISNDSLVFPAGFPLVQKKQPWADWAAALCLSV